MLNWFNKYWHKRRFKLSHAEINASRGIDIKDVKTLICFLGPYRNLTTLTASVGALHPNFQVLNHASSRIFPHHEIDFFSDYSVEKLNLFLKYAIQISGKGQRGRKGGSILHAHAFDNGEAKRLYAKRFGKQLIKDNIVSVLWKEGLHLSNHLILQNTSPLDLAKKDPRVKFLLPIRNVLDCAVSNKKTGLAQIYPNIHPGSSLKEITTTILNDYLDFFRNQEKLPNSFFHYYQDNFNTDMLRDLAVFAKIPFDQQWAKDVFSAFQIKSVYKHDTETINIYNSLVMQMFEDFPKEKAALLSFKN